MKEILANPNDIEWMAGLFEGEGCVSIHWNKNGYGYPKVVLGMSDEDVINRLHNSVGFGTVAMRSYQRKKPMWYWSISEKSEMLVFLRALLPQMGLRRSEKFKEAIGVIEASMAPQTCCWCPTMFSPKKRGTKYCSVKCRKEANR